MDPRAGLNVTSVAIADDHPLFRDGLRRVIATGPGLRFVGEAGDGQEALELCSREKPTVLLLDIMMPRCNGYAVLEQLPVVSPDTRALVVSGYMERAREERALASGARGFLDKDASVQTIVKAIRAVAAGEVWATRKGAYQSFRRSAPGRDDRLFGSLSPREREILGMLGRGWSTKPIASRTGLSEKTVSAHIAHVLEKLEVRSRLQAALLARQYADLEPEGLLEDTEAP
jgi:two-component system, NarL family, nitrate/nitrite response regulator NarL